MLARIAAREQRLLRRRGLDPSDTDLSPPDPVVEESALTPQPRINLVLYPGVLAPHARWRARGRVRRNACPGAGALDPVRGGPGSAAEPL